MFDHFLLKALFAGSARPDKFFISALLGNGKIDASRQYYWQFLKDRFTSVWNCF